MRRTILGIEALETRQMLDGQTYWVTSLDDVDVAGTTTDNYWSFREALAAAANDGQNDRDTIKMPAGTFTLGVQGQIPITSSVDIVGPGAGQIKIDAHQASRVFEVSAGAAVTLQGMTITGGNAAYGAGIYNAGSLGVFDSVIQSNSGSYGAALYSPSGGGDVQLLRTRINSNSASVDNAGVTIAAAASVTIDQVTMLSNYGGYGSGGLVVSSTPLVTITNSTFADNRGGYGSGGVIINGGATVRMSGDTITGNYGGYGGGGLYVNATDAVLTNLTVTQNHGSGYSGVSANGSVAMHNSIVATNYVGSGTTTLSNDLSGTFLASSSHNLIGKDSNTSNNIDHQPFSGKFNQVGGQGVSDVIDPLLAPLGDFGGPTWTHAVLPGSPAIDKGTSSGSTIPAVDQRGFARYDDASVAGDLTVDVGAFEYQPTTNNFLVTTLADAGVESGKLSLRQALNLARVIPGTDVIQFDPSLFVNGGKTLTLAYDSTDANTVPDQFLIDSSVTIEGPGASLLSISGNDQTRVFEVASGQTVTIRGLTVTRGYANGTNGSFSGGGIRSLGTLTLDQVEVTDSDATEFGGGVYASGVLTINNSTFTGNFGSYQGGGVYGGSVYVTNSTFSGNSTSYNGAGIYAGYVSITNSTIAFNQAQSSGSGGGGIYASSGAVTNSIIVGNSAYNSGEYDVKGSYLSASYNIVGPVGSSTYLSGSFNQIGVAVASVALAPLGDYGGPTRTHALLAGSIAIDKGTSSGSTIPAVDQRGFARPMDGDDANGAQPDVGAYEWQPAPTIVVNTAKDSGLSAGEMSLRLAIQTAAHGSVIKFADSLDGQTIRLGDASDLIVNKSLTIDASSLASRLKIVAYDIEEDHDQDEASPDPVTGTTPRIRLSNANGGRVFLIKGDDVEVTLRNLTLSGGDSWDGGGAIRALGKSLTLENVEVSHNAAPRTAGYEILGNYGFIEPENPLNNQPICGDWMHGAAGGGVFSTGDLVIRDSYFTNNATYNFDGPLSDTYEQRFCRGEIFNPETGEPFEGTGGPPPSGVRMGEIYAGDIYTLGDVLIERTTFKIEELPTGAEGVDDDNQNLALGGVYVTNRRTADAIVTLTDVDFINTRGIALDGAQVSDGPGYNTDATVGSIDYEIRSVVGGNLRIGAPNSSDAITLVGGLGFQPIGIRRDKLGSIYFEHVPSALPGPPTQPPGFEIREV